MSPDPISNYKALVRSLQEAKKEREQKLAHYTVIENILETAVKGNLPESFLADYRRQLADAGESSRRADAEWTSLDKAAEQARRSLGTELQDEVRSAISVLQDYLSNVGLRDRVGGQLVFEEALQHIKTASELNDFIFTGATGAVSAGATGSTNHQEAVAQPAPPAQVGFEGLPLPKEVGLPAELSEYYSNAKNGYSLKDFGERFRSSLESLLAKADNDLDKLARYLSKYGLNAGQVTAVMVDGLFRNAGISMQTRKVALIAPNGKVYWGNSHISAARLYMEEVLGLKALAERCSSLFNAGFSVTKAPAGSVAEYSLVLQGFNKDRLTELLQRIAQRLRCTAPKWKT